MSRVRNRCHAEGVCVGASKNFTIPGVSSKAGGPDCCVWGVMAGGPASLMPGFERAGYGICAMLGVLVALLPVVCGLSWAGNGIDAMLGASVLGQARTSPPKGERQGWWCCFLCGVGLNGRARDQCLVWGAGGICVGASKNFVIPGVSSVPGGDASCVWEGPEWMVTGNVPFGAFKGMVCVARRPPNSRYRAHR